MLPNGGRAHVSKYHPTALPFLLALNSQQNSATLHPFLMSPTTVRKMRKMMERGISEDFT